MNRPEQKIIPLDDAMRFAAQWQHEGQLARAEDILNRILQAQPQHAHAWHLLGVIAHQVGKTTLGIQLIQRAISFDASVALFHSNLGEMHRQIHALELSIASGVRATKLDPHSAVAFSNLGVAYYDAKDLDQAEVCHLRALELDPKQSNSLNNMGSLHKERKNAADAQRYYRAAIVAAPNYVDPLNNLAAMLIIEQQFNEAIVLLNRALKLAPAFADAYCNLGFALLGVDNHDAALQNFQRALQLKPNYAESYTGLCKVHSAKTEYEKAEKYALQAIAINPSKPEFYQTLAEVYTEQGQAQLALSYFDRALALDPTLGSAQVSKANLLIELGEAPAAEALLALALKDRYYATQLSAHCSIVQMRTVKANDHSMQALVAMTARSEQLSLNQREYLHFSLGKCYDDIGRWDEAFKHFSTGCKLKRSRIQYSRDEPTQLLKRIMQNYTPKTIERLRLAANTSELPIFVLGMPRSGTTLVEQIIASHPQVHGAGELKYLSMLSHRGVEGEKHPYPENIFLLSPDATRAIAEEYLRLLQSHAPTFARITDKMPGNFMLIGLIHGLFPQAKIIHVERNPIDTCLSCYTKLFRHGQSFSYDLAELAHFYACYRQIMAHWRRILPADAWFDVRYETLVTDLEGQAKKLIAYCGLEWDSGCLDFHTSKRHVRTASLTQVRKPIYTTSVERWRRFEKELAPLINVLSDQLCL